jgi:energy-coupling factor transporter ATP-binding protein EcfA2
MNITTGKIKKAQRVIVYGPEGIGKSTFGSQFPNPVFIDTEGGTNHLDVPRTDKPNSWAMLIAQVKELSTMEFKTIIIDTIDWAEKLCIEHICNLGQVDSISKFDFGKGHIRISEEMGKLLNLLTYANEKGIHTVLLAHAWIRKFEQPDQMSAYDRWELKLSKQASPLVKEWADAVIFANYETFTVTDDKTKIKKAQGGSRVMHTSHDPCWDAKNRSDLPEKLDFKFSEIAHVFELPKAEEIKKKTMVAPEADVRKPIVNEVGEDKECGPSFPHPETPDFGDKEWGPSLRQLCEKDGISVSQIRQMAFKRGIYPFETPISNYDDAYIGNFIAKWDTVVEYIKEMEFESIKQH